MITRFGFKSDLNGIPFMLFREGNSPIYFVVRGRVSDRARDVYLSATRTLSHRWKVRIVKILRGIVATTHIDKHFERLSLSALKSMAEQTNIAYLPFMVEHDPRIPPKGRTVFAKVVKLSDGEYGLETITEEFEPGKYVKFKNDGREIPLHEHSLNQLDIRFDRNFRYDDDQRLIEDLSQLFESRPIEEGKKSVDPITILTIGGLFILGGIAKGVLSKIGGDSYEIVKDKLKNLMKRKPEEKEKLLRFEFTVQRGVHEIVAEAILTNPEGEDIDGFLDEGLKVLDERLPQLFLLSSEIKKAVFEYKRGDLTLKFAVRKDAVPLIPIQVKTRIDRAQKKLQKQAKKKARKK